MEIKCSIWGSRMYITVHYSYKLNKQGCITLSVMKWKEAVWGDDHLPEPGVLKGGGAARLVCCQTAKQLRWFYRGVHLLEERSRKWGGVERAGNGPGLVGWAPRENDRGLSDTFRKSDKEAEVGVCPRGPVQWPGPSISWPVNRAWSDWRFFWKKATHIQTKETSLIEKLWFSCSSLADSSLIHIKVTFPVLWSVLRGKYLLLWIFCCCQIRICLHEPSQGRNERRLQQH